MHVKKGNVPLFFFFLAKTETVWKQLFSFDVPYPSKAGLQSKRSLVMTGRKNEAAGYQIRGGDDLALQNHIKSGILFLPCRIKIE